MIEIMKYLANKEGKKIHFNDGEEDVTLPYGIYMKYDSELYKYINKLAIKETQEEISIKNMDYINSVMDNEIVLKLAESFYKEFYKKAFVNMFPEDSQLTRISTFTLSPVNSNRAVQMAINDFITNKLISIPNLKTKKGIFGRNSKGGMSAINKMLETNDHSLLFESYIICNFQNITDELVIKNPDKYLKYLRGWNNRLNHLRRYK